jgi:hypothetical protein
LSKQAVEALKEGNLSSAESLLKNLTAKEDKQIEKQQERAARNHFNLGSVYELQFKPLLALSEYEQAYRYRPQEYKYAGEYACPPSCYSVFFEPHRSTDHPKKIPVTPNIPGSGTALGVPMVVTAEKLFTVVVPSRLMFLSWWQT